MTIKVWQTLVYSLRHSRGQKGLGLVETLMAVAILGTSVVAFVTALSGGSIAVGEHDDQAIGQGLAQSQLEYTKSYTFNPSATTYPLVSVPAGYSVSVDVSSVPNTDTNIQKITVTVNHDSEEIIQVEGYKLNR